MSLIRFLLAGSALASSSTVFAADELKFAKAPAWVIEQTIPQTASKGQDGPVAVLLHDQQTLLEPGKVSTYSELAFKIQKPEGLAAGNISIPWNPATDTVTVNRLEIRRGNQIIDVLKSGQTFTTMRRESNLELATLDGVLTANIQPEGLQEGDVVVLATTVDHTDPVLKGHVEAAFAPWGEAQIALGHARLAWAPNVVLKLQKTGDLPAPQQDTRDGKQVYELTMRDVKPVIMPKGAPTRFKLGRLGEATDFKSWAEAARLMEPLYRDTAKIPASGPLRDEVEKIRKASTDPKVRAGQALQLVQQRVRYVALLMGQGGLVPAPAETTWSRRFGDCKAKTALLLAILHELGIKAEPVLANPFLGDAISEQLPMLSFFNHVLVHAHVGAKDYWLDGTRSGDTNLDSIEVPDFGWGLPLIENAQLVHMVPAPRNDPSGEHRVKVNVSAGIFAPAEISIEEVYRGDFAVEMNALYSSLSSDQRDEQFHDKATGYFDSFTVASSSFQFDKDKQELNILIKGTARLNWKDGWFDVPTSSIGFNPDFDRPAGSLHDVPIKVSHPRFVKDIATFQLPPGFAAQQKLDAKVRETLAGVEYTRTESVIGDVLSVETSERSIASEVPYKEAVAAVARLRALNKDDVYLSSAVTYRGTDKDLAALAEATPGSAQEYRARGTVYLDRGKYDDAIADFTAELKLEPGNKWALADRGLAHVWKREFGDAEKDLAAAEALDSGNAEVLRARGLMAEFKADCAIAIDFYTRSLAKEPDSNFTIGHRASCEAALLRDDPALADSGNALKADPAWMDLRVLRANIYLREGKHELVAAEAEVLTRENPKSEFAWTVAAQIYAALGQRDRAMLAFDHALGIKPQPYVYVDRSQARPRSDVAGRIGDLDAALKLDPNNGGALSLKAQQLSNGGDYRGALALLDRIKADPDDQYVHQERAILLYKAGQASEAQNLFQSMRSTAKTADQLNGLCWTKAIHDVLLDSALQDCRDALKIRPDTGQYLDSLGMVLLKLGKLDEALEAYNQSIAKGIGADSLMGRAFVYLRKGDQPRAEADAAAARKQFPNIDEVFAEYGLKFEGPAAKAAAVGQAVRKP